MKYQFKFIFTFLLFTQVAFASGIDFFHGTWKEALAEAKAKEKIIFIDAYASWCGPCKRMAATVFTQEEVGEFYNKNFICMKLDMEKEEAIDVRKAFPVDAYPTFLFVDSNGKLVHRTKGAMEAEAFIGLGKSALSKMDFSAEFAKKYEAGDRTPELILNYVKTLNKSGKPSLKVANDYLYTQKDLTTDFNLKFIYEATVEADSRIFDLLIQHKEKIKLLVGETAINDRIAFAANNTLQKAIQFKSMDLLKEAQQKMAKGDKPKADLFELESNLKYYKGINDSKNFLKAADAYAKKGISEDAKKLYFLAKDVCETCPKDDEALKKAEKIAEKAADGSGIVDYYFLYASILNKNGKKADALKNARKALEIAKEEKKATQNIELLIKQIEGGA